MRQLEPVLTEDFLLLEKVKDGSKIAFNLLFEKHWQKAYSDAYKRLKNAEDAKDILQEIFTKIWLNRQTQSIENFPAYLHASIRNNVIKLLSKQKPIYPFFDILENIPQKNSEADSALLWNEFLKSYQALLEKMPPKRQQIFKLRYQEDLTTKDISVQMGITRKTVQNQLAKAIESLKVALNIVSFIGLILITLPLFN
jgi:RNA polymerase sigma-70 factor (ECF subfamily)